MDGGFGGCGDGDGGGGRRGLIADGAVLDRPILWWPLLARDPGVLQTVARRRSLVLLERQHRQQERRERLGSLERPLVFLRQYL